MVLICDEEGAADGGDGDSTHNEYSSGKQLCYTRCHHKQDARPSNSLAEIGRESSVRRCLPEFLVTRTNNFIIIQMHVEYVKKHSS